MCTPIVFCQSFGRSVCIWTSEFFARLTLFSAFFNLKLSLLRRKILSGVLGGQRARNIVERACQLFFESFGRSVCLWIDWFSMRLVHFSAQFDYKEWWYRMMIQNDDMEWWYGMMIQNDDTDRSWSSSSSSSPSSSSSSSSSSPPSNLTSIVA